MKALWVTNLPPTNLMRVTFGRVTYGEQNTGERQIVDQHDIVMTEDEWLDLLRRVLIVRFKNADNKETLA